MHGGLTKKQSFNKRNISELWTKARGQRVLNLILEDYLIY